MRSHDRSYFDQDRIWDSQVNPGERECISLIERLWPADATSLLDAGAGAGRVINALKIPAEIVACDLSHTALKRVQAPSVVSLVTALPFRDRSFDAVLCSNVLEHLTTTD